MANPRLFAMLVGIDEFKADYSTLRGCVKDVNRIEKYIHKYHSSPGNPPNILKLTNEQATYEAIKSGFRNHLRAAGPNDIVWFHISTHGSEEHTAPEFKESIEPGGRDQTVVCHDSGQAGIPHLADKEFAVLLHEVATTTVQGEPKESPHMIVTLDSCHSGSGTRAGGEEDPILPRAVESTGKGRTLESYVDGYYAKQGDKFNVPISRHLLISGCRNSEFAGDMSKGGVFTQSLIDALEKAKSNTSYADLFIQTRSQVKKTRDEQVPQFQTIDSFNPYTKFLDGSPAGSPDRYEVVEEEDGWFVKCGAIHGLPSRPGTKIDFDVLSPSPENKVIGKGVITSVGAQKSKIDVDWNSFTQRIADRVSTDSKSYQAVIHHFPAEPVFVKVSGEGVDNIQESWSDGKSIYLAKNEEQNADAELEILGQDEKYVLKDLKTNREFTLTDDLSMKSAEFVIDSVDHVVTWKRMVDLRNDNQSSKLPPLIDFRMKIEDLDGNITVHDESEISLKVNAANAFNASEQGSGDRLMIFHPEVTVKKARQDLYFYLFQLQEDFSITCAEDQKMYEYKRMKDKDEVVIPLWSEQMRGWGLYPDQNTSQTHFKLIATTEELDHNQLQQSALAANRKTGTVVIQRAHISNDWWSFDISINMTRED